MPLAVAHQVLLNSLPLSEVGLLAVIDKPTDVHSEENPNTAKPVCNWCLWEAAVDAS